MKQLYDTLTNKPVGKMRSSTGLSIFKPYLPSLASVIELEVEFLNPQEYDTRTQKLLGGYWSADLENLKWRKTWQIVQKTETEIIRDSWEYKKYAKRIICPIQLGFDDIGVKIYVWFKLNNLPIKSDGSTVELYCNEILPEHQQIVDSLNNLIQIQERPD